MHIEYVDKSKLGIGLHIEPWALDAQVWDEQVVCVPLVIKLHEGFVLHAIESLLASEHYENALQVPIVGEVELAGVNAHWPSVPFPVQASLVVYDEQAAFGIHLVPSETQSTLFIATAHYEDVVNAKSVQVLIRQDCVVEFVLVAQKQSPSVPTWQAAYTELDEHVPNTIQPVPLVLHFVFALIRNELHPEYVVNDETSVAVASEHYFNLQVPVAPVPATHWHFPSVPKFPQAT